MLDKMIGVSPPQAGEAREAKVTDLKDFRGSAEKTAQYKMDFERTLKEKNWQQKKDLEQRKESERREELRAEKQKKSSGGIKKKVTEVDDKMVSNSMASNESVVETPVSKVEETAKIEVNSEKNKSDIESLIARLSNLDSEKVGSDGVTSAETLEHTSTDVTTAALNESEALTEEPLQATGKQSGSHLSAFEQELGEAVQYESLTPLQKPEPELKLEAELKESKATDQFEKNVLMQLQKENSFSGDTSSSSQDKGFEQSDKKDVSSGNELHQAAGQSHSGFKAQLEGASAGAKPTQDIAARLEQNREANINEIMNQAQYLVKKGGGEVSVKMSPEGMGEVQLRVQLLNGKLNIEMQTQDREVKKLIEDSLSDLKSGLAAHRLSLEHVKVDTVAATNTDNSAQLQSNLNQGRHEGQAQNAWNDVQQQMQNQSQQNGRSHFQRRENNLSLEPVSLPQVSQAQGLRTYGGTKGSTINRVA